MSDRDERDKFDKAYVALHGQFDEQEASKCITEAVISGRLSFFLLADRALRENLTLEQFVTSTKQIINEEIRTGAVDETSFKVLEDFNYPYDRLP